MIILIGINEYLWHTSLNATYSVNFLLFGPSIECQIIFEQIHLPSEPKKSFLPYAIF